MGQAVFETHHFPILLRAVREVLGDCLGEKVPKGSREKKQIAGFLFCKFILWCMLASCFFPLLFSHQDDLSLFSQVCLVPRNQTGITGKQRELFPAPSAWWLSPSCFLLWCSKVDPPSLHLELIHQGCDANKWPSTSWFVVPVLHLPVSGFLSLLPPQISTVMLTIPATSSLPWHHAHSRLAHHRSAPTQV